MPDSPMACTPVRLRSVTSSVLVCPETIISLEWRSPRDVPSGLSPCTKMGTMPTARSSFTSSTMEARSESLPIAWRPSFSTTRLPAKREMYVSASVTRFTLNLGE